ncbi:MAG: hypothetical protein MUC85_03410 [Anaerolineales bacterium]|jgi:hypothetical protein|nr:hypothetical protein [Anaerolineales bacterium]
MLQAFSGIVKTLNQLLTAGIAITAFSLLLYALTFNLRDRVARSFAMILACVVVIFVGDAISSVASTEQEVAFWLKTQWVGIIFLPPAYLHFSDALLATTGRPSRGRRRMAVRVMYATGLVFLAALVLGSLVGPLVVQDEPAPYLSRTPLTVIFTVFYFLVMVWAMVNFWRAYQRTVTSSSKRRMTYLLAGATAPALGSFPYLLFGSGFAAEHQLIFWLLAMISNLMVSVLLIVMAYSVAFFGVSWPDRVVKRRLFKWIMRGPVTASTVLALVTIIRRVGERFGETYSEAVPIVMVGSLLLMEYLVTLAAPHWERLLFHGGDRASMTLLQSLEERLLTRGDLFQFLESVLTAVCDRLQVNNAFMAGLGNEGIDMWVSVGSNTPLQEDLVDVLLEQVNKTDTDWEIFTDGRYWLVPLFGQETDGLLGLLGVPRDPARELEGEQKDDLKLLSQRAALALEDRKKQQEMVASLEALTPQVDLIQRMRAAARYDRSQMMVDPATLAQPESDELITQYVRDALTHYWGGPKLTESPLMKLQVVQNAMDEHQGNSSNALRSILKRAVEQVRPEGERRFTGEWILYNILEMKFMEGRKVREVALRLAMSEADLYRKQRIAIETVANKILEMEQQAREEAPDSVIAGRRSEF